MVGIVFSLLDDFLQNMELPDNVKALDRLCYNSQTGSKYVGCVICVKRKITSRTGDCKLHDKTMHVLYETQNEKREIGDHKRKRQR